MSFFFFFDFFCVSNSQSKLYQALIIGSPNLCSRSKVADYWKCAINNAIIGCQNNLTRTLIVVCIEVRILSQLTD